MRDTIEKAKVFERNKARLLNYKDRAEKLGLTEQVKQAKELLKELKGQGDNFDESKLEVLNYALYKAGLTIEIEQYIKEKTKGIEMAIKYASEGKSVLFIAPTGTGKAFTTYGLIKRYDLSTLTVLPNAAIAEQQGGSYHTLSSHGKIKDNPNKSLQYCISNAKVVFCTWNKYIDLCKDEAFLEENKDMLKDIILIIDESHEIYSNEFRADKARDVVKAVKRGIFKGVIAMTATPTREDFKIYDEIIEYKRTKNKNYQIKLYDTVCDKYMIDYINSLPSTSRVVIFEDNIKHLEYYKSELKIKVDIVHADNKEKSVLYKNLMKNKTMGKVYRGMLHTSALVAGFDNNDKDVTDIFLVNVKDPAKILQICARYREVEGLNIHIFNNYPKEQYEFNFLQYRIERRIESEMRRAEECNRDIEEEGVDSFLDGYSSTLEDDETVYFDKATKKCMVNEVAIRTNIYDTYYKRRSRKQFEVLLREYFTDITLVNLTEDESLDLKNTGRKIFIDKMTKEGKAAIDSMKAHMKILPLADKIISKEPLTNDEQIYLKNSKNTINDLEVLLRFFKVDKMLENEVFRQHISALTYYVVDKHIEIQLAWELASLDEKEKKDFLQTINVIGYNSFRNEYPKQAKFKEKVSIEAGRFGFVLGLGAEGKWFTAEHYDLVYNDYKESNKNDVKVKKKDIRGLMENTYNPIRSDVKPTDKFYKDIVPDFKGKNKMKGYRYEKIATLESVAKRLNVSPNNKSLIDLVNGNKTLD